MDADSVFELSGTHDAGSAAATANILFRRFFRLIGVPAGVGLVLLLVGAIWAWSYLMTAAGIWIFGGLVAIEIALLITTRLRIHRRLKARIGKSIQVCLGPENVSWTWGNEAHTMPWSKFKGVSTDGRNLYLFLTRTIVFAVPNQRDPEAAARYAWLRVGHAGGAAK
jgi:hypothetical protein